MEEKFKQLNLEPPTKGLGTKAAALSLLPDKLESRYGVKFQNSVDDLDYFKGSKLKIDESYYELVHYLRAPTKDTIIIVMSNKTFEQQAKDLKKFLQAFGLTKSDLTWINPELYEIK